MPTTEGYNGAYTGQQIDSAIGAVANKQDKLTGVQGQVVGFDESGKAVAQDAPSGLPDGGTPGQMLWQGESGPEWGDRPVMYVNITTTPSETSADKSYAQIVAAKEAGYAVFALYSTTIIPLVSIQSNQIVFSVRTYSNERGASLQIAISKNNIVAVSMGLETTNAKDVEFSPASSGLSSTNVQDAIDELASRGNGALYVHLEYSYPNTSGTADKTAEEVYQAYQDGLAVFLVVQPFPDLIYDIIPLSLAENEDGVIRVEFTKSVMFGDGTTNPYDPFTQVTFEMNNQEPGASVNVTYHRLSADRIEINSIEGLEAYSVQGALEEINAKIPEQIPEQSTSSGPKIATVTISGTGWQGGEPPGSPSLIPPVTPVEKGEPAYQVVTVEGVIADSSAQVISVVPATREDMDKWNTYGVWCTDQWAGRLVFTCESCPVDESPTPDPTPDPTPGDTPGTPGTPDSPDSESYDIQVNVCMWEVST